MLDQCRLADLVSSAMQHGGARPLEPEAVTVAGCWQSRTAYLYRCLLDHPQERDMVVVAKVMKDHNRSMQRYHEAMMRLSDLLPQGSGQRAYALPSLGYNQSPPVLVTPYIEGSDLVPSVLRESLCLQSEEAMTKFQWLITRCGETLGVYHMALMVQNDDRDIPAKAQALDDLMKTAQSVRLPWQRSIQGTLNTLPVAANYGDFAPYNFRVRPDGQLVLLDAPYKQSIAVVHEDVAWFLFELRRQIYWHRSWIPKYRWQELARRLTESFLQGYSVTGPQDMRSDGNMQIIKLYLIRRALGIARKRLRSRLRRHEALWYLWLASSGYLSTIFCARGDIQR